MAYFVESPDIDKIEGKKAICKFQKVELIYKDILALYSEYSSRITKRKRSGELAEVITFTSPACGSGVTSMAAAFALNCSLNNKSALYLSMENIPTTDIIFDDSDSIEQIKQYLAKYIDEKLKTVIPPDGYELVIIKKSNV